MEAAPIHWCAVFARNMKLTNKKNRTAEWPWCGRRGAVGAIEYSRCLTMIDRNYNSHKKLQFLPHHHHRAGHSAARIN